ncbi:FxsA family protein [Actinokineospora inagensis]|uniref:FxsA family protein n=1 Tax=Actinokineospora inagensis TaxID=103730 RepID=UPI0003FDE688|nr:FxsA family protein [Actinokineospora inagensis]
MPVLLIILLAIAAEITVMVSIGSLIGVLPTIALLVLATVLGGYLLRREGLRTLAALREAVFLRRTPEREVVDGMLIAAAGVLVALPGFISDVVALFLLFPPTRALVRRRVIRRAESRGPIVVVGSVVPDRPVDLPGPRVVEGGVEPGR